MKTLSFLTKSSIVVAALLALPGAAEARGRRPAPAPLVADGNGNCSADVAGAGAGQGYQFVTHHGSDTLVKSDPRARRVTSSVGASVIVDPAAFAWTSSFRAPPFNEQVVYEMHVGSF